MALCLGSAVSKQLKESASATALSKEWLDIAGLQNATLFVYSLYNYAFVSLSSSAAAQTALSVAMQLTKMGFKFAVNRKISQYPDIKAEAVIFNVEVSHALFVTFSMQSATSVATLAVLVALDFLHALATYYEVKAPTRTVQSLELELNELQAALSDPGVTVQPASADRVTVVDKAAAILAKRAAAFQPERRPTKTEEDAPAVIAISKRGLCGSRRKVAVLAAKAAPSRSPSAQSLKVAPHRVLNSSALVMMSAIVPSPAALLAPTDEWRQVDRNLETFGRQTRSSASEARAEKSLAQLQDVYVERVLALLHMTEFAVLTEFVEFVVPHDLQ